MLYIDNFLSKPLFYIYIYIYAHIYIIRTFIGWEKSQAAPNVDAHAAMVLQIKEKTRRISLKINIFCVSAETETHLLEIDLLFVWELVSLQRDCIKHVSKPTQRKTLDLHTHICPKNFAMERLFDVNQSNANLDQIRNKTSQVHCSWKRALQRSVSSTSAKANLNRSMKLQTHRIV